MEIRTPNSLVFGIQGWDYGEVRPRTITFFTDGTTKVSDHRGNPIAEFAGSHAEAIKKLSDVGVDWQKLDTAGWPQIPYAELKGLVVVPPTPLDELARIKNRVLRADAIKMRNEFDAAALEELEV